MADDDGTVSYETVVSTNMNILVKNTYREADLTITKNIGGDINPDQSFIFLVENNETGLSMQVAIPSETFTDGTASITIKDLKLGDYAIKEITDWSWRYEPNSNVSTENDSAASATNEQIVISLQHGGETVIFTNSRENDFWLSGDSYAENWFGIFAETDR